MRTSVFDLTTQERNAFIMRCYKKGFRIPTIAEYLYLTEEQVNRIIKREEKKNAKKDI